MVGSSFSLVKKIIGVSHFLLFSIFGILVSFLELLVSAIVIEKLIGGDFENNFEFIKYFEENFFFVLSTTGVLRLLFIYLSASIPMNRVHGYVIRSWNNQLLHLGTDPNSNKDINTYSARANLLAKAIIFPGFSLVIALASIFGILLLSIVFFDIANLYPIIILLLLFVIITGITKNKLKAFSYSLNNQIDNQLALLREFFPHRLQIISFGQFSSYKDKFSSVYKIITDINAKLIFFAEAPRVVIEILIFLILLYSTSLFPNYNLTISSAIILRLIPLLQKAYRSNVNLRSNTDLSKDFLNTQTKSEHLNEEFSLRQKQVFKIYGNAVRLDNNILFQKVNILKGNSGVGKSSFAKVFAKKFLSGDDPKVFFIGQEPLVNNLMITTILNGSSSLKLGGFLSDIDLNRNISTLGTNLSGGQKKRLSVVYGLIVARNGFLILDEPDSGLDEGRKKELELLISENMNQGLIITHSNLFQESRFNQITLHEAGFS